MDTTSYLTAAVATAKIDSRIREAKASRLVAEARRSPDTRQPEACCPPIRSARFPRPSMAGRGVIQLRPSRAR